MKHEDINKTSSVPSEILEELLSEEEYEDKAEAPSLAEEFRSRRRGPDLRLPLGLLITLLIMGGLGYFLWQYMQQPEAHQGGTLIINEICTSNHKSLVSETLGTPDWVELYNGTQKALNLKGYGLTDNPKQSYKFVLPEVTVEPGGYLLVYFVGGSEEADSDPLCTGFGLSRYGEDILLVDANYNLLDSVEVPALEPDVSYARMADGSWGYAVIPTPNQANNEENIIPAWQ